MGYFDDWNDAGKGYLTSAVADKLLVVRPSLDGWVLRLSTGGELEPWSLDFLWQAETLDELEGAARFLEKYVKQTELLSSRPDITTVNEIEGGFTIEANRLRGRSFRVFLRDAKGETVGDYSGFLNTALPSFVMGEITIQGSEMLSDIARGKGIGDKMRDAAEAVMELKAVPHGRTFTQGSLSEAAARSWAKRAATKYVPGLSPNIHVDVRRKLAEAVMEADRSNRYADPLAATILLSRRTGCDAVIAFLDGEPRAGWAISDEGLPIYTGGMIDAAAVEDHCRFGFSSFGNEPGDRLCFRRVNSAEVDALIDAERISHLRNAETDDFVDRMASRMLAGKLPLPQGSLERSPHPNPEAYLAMPERR